METCSFSQLATGGDLRKRTVRSEKGLKVFLRRIGIFFFLPNRYVKRITQFIEGAS
jgi:hypothetical protein